MTTVAVKEWPILMSGPMVQALNENRKSQTRRVVTLANSSRQASPNKFPFDLDRAWRDPGFPQFHDGRKCEYLHVPFCHPEEGWEQDPRDDTVERWYCKWQPGDRLWVRETFWEYPGIISDRLLREGADTWPEVLYDADCDQDWCVQHNWVRRPSIFLRREHCRITLEITEVRVQLLTQISREDRIAEGIVSGSAVEFQKLWDSINAKRGFGWDKNPWVWAITFKRL